jgi:hypothetical protein
VRLSRRHLLAAAGLLSTAAVVGTVGVGLGYQAWWDQPHDARTRHLSEDELAFVDALADAMFPPSPKLPLRGRDANVGRYVDLVLDGMEPLQRKLLRLSLHALDQWPRATHGKPFRELDEGAGAEVLASWVGHRRAEVRGLIASVYIFVGMAYTVHPQVAPIFREQFRCGYGE